MLWFEQFTATQLLGIFCFCFEKKKQYLKQFSLADLLVSERFVFTQAKNKNGSRKEIFTVNGICRIGECIKKSEKCDVTKM